MFEEIFRGFSDQKKIKKDLLDRKTVQLNGCVPSQLEHFIYCTAEDFKRRLIITYDELKAVEMLGNYTAYDKAAMYYPAKDPVFHEASLQGNFISEQRMEVVRRLYDNEPLTVITTKEAFSDKLRSFEEIKKDSITVSEGDDIDIEELSEKLTALGYSREDSVTARGEFAVRGNIVDIFPYTEAAPVRIDLWGDTVETLKHFDAESQRSFEELERVTVFAGGDSDLKETGEVDFLDYFGKEETLTVFHEPGKLFTEEDRPFIEKTEGFSRLLTSTLGAGCDLLEADTKYTVNARNIPSYNGRFKELTADLLKYKERGFDVTLCAASPLRADNLRKELMDGGISVNVISGNIKTGFEYPDLKFALISEVDIFGSRRKRRKKKRFTGDPIKAFTDLHVGDYVVHEQHGIGQYMGIERLKSDGIEKDYMKIRYANGAFLYVLATQFDRIQKYSGKEQTAPKLSKLGGKEWINTKARVKGAVQDIAQDLVKLYAERQKSTGYRCGPDTVWQREFEEEFEFEETEDQLSAIEAVKADMESSRIMDRLICGDVGFGKTEVAIRAAFKAVQEGKQVAFLCPTTILARQHYNTISRRMRNYPVNVRMLSRFVSSKDQSRTIKELKSGMADIVVGTHRLLSKDVTFKDLGLLVVDEEQRFGVTHKEKIKQLRKNVDVLTLSATPIPRTLHMSLSGIRDMSLLTEPPVDRVPIQTYVTEYTPEAVKEAITREASRGGQVYYLYNRTNNIDMAADEIRDLVPGLNVEFAHGKMSPKDLEEIMEDFVNGRIDVLVSTTIIEMGLDIPNVNTIIIQDADNFGLSQLYQLRGRVGRSNRTAYAFLLYRKDKLIKEVAEKRLKAIREFSDLGSGVKIAMRDLEIRGAGNILGAEQSGHMGEVGYELYCKMLNEAVALLKGETVEEDFETTIDLDIDGFIPADYISSETEKLDIYRKISAASGEEEADDIRLELEDRFGEIPSVVDNLICVALIKAAAHKLYITDIEEKDDSFKVSMLKNAKIDTYKMHGFLSSHSDTIRFVTGNQPYFIYTPKKFPTGAEKMKDTLFEFFGLLSEITE